MPNKEEKIADIARRLASLSPQAQDLELTRLERLIAKQEAEARVRALAKHQGGLAAALVDAVVRYADDHKVPVERLIPVSATVVRNDDGALVGTISDPRSGSSGRTRGPGFLREQGVVAIELNGEALKMCAESEVLRVAYGVRTAKEVYKNSSPHAVAMKPEVLGVIREKGFVAVFGDGRKEPLADLYSRSRRRKSRTGS